MSKRKRINISVDEELYMRLQRIKEEYGFKNVCEFNVAALELLCQRIEDNECECNLYIFYHDKGVSIYYEDDYSEQPAFFSGKDILNLAYQMLCWIAGNGYLKNKEE